MSWLSEAVGHPDAASLSAVAACAAATVALTGAAFQFFIGRQQARAALLSAQAALANARNGETSAQAALISAKNAGRYKIAEFRQAWIEKVIDAFCELISIIAHKPDDEPLSPEEKKILYASRTRLGILLNPEEVDTVELLNAVDDLFKRAPEEQDASVTLTVARRLLKREWVRIKDELSHVPAD
jgi:hypothetical protein